MEERSVSKMQDIFSKGLEVLGFNPFSITYVNIEDSRYCQGGFLSVTFYFKEEFYQFLDLLDYKSMCDSSGITILEDTLTVYLSGIALFNLISICNSYETVN